MKKTKADAQKTKHALLASALDIFFKRGVSRASLQEIAIHAGLTRGALYWHFKNKEDLFDALFQQMFSQIQAQVQHDINTNSPDILNNFIQTIQQLFQRLTTDSDYYKFCHILHLDCEHTEDNSAIVKLLQKYQNMWHQNLCNVFTICQQQQTLPQELDISLAALYFQALFMGMTTVWLANPHHFDITTVSTKFIQTTLASLQHNPNLHAASSKLPVTS
ncbi:TetR family transcriptional regulator [Neisseriaceae bacterium ESL0693]|nr:TetR family transcriptional regulator [Neisseriaceae bacterium ESL0693]